MTSLYAAREDASRAQECFRDLGIGPRLCKSPLCQRPLAKQNRSGFCNECRKRGDRWCAKARRLDLKRRGICCACKGRPARGYYCDPCRVAHSEGGVRRYREDPATRARRCVAQAAYVARLRAKGRCYRCGGSGLDGFKTCPRCRKLRREYEMARRKRGAA